MSDEPPPDPQRLAHYRAAVDDLPPLTRVIFLLNRVDDLSYSQIAERLSITIAAVECCLAEALLMIRATLIGETRTRWRRELIVQAETALRLRHRRYCEDGLRKLGGVNPLLWDDAGDDDMALMQAKLATMPPDALETFLLHRVDHLSYAEIARRKRTFQWIIRRRMLRAIRHIMKGPMRFEEWLTQQI